MSSHHFVREGQEPALFILDPVDFELAGPLLEWAPLVMVSEHALDEVLQWCIKIDGVSVYEGDEATEKKVSAQSPLKILNVSPEISLLKQVFDYLISQKQTGVNVLTTSPERVFADAESTTAHLHANIVDKYHRWVGISTGRFEKWLAMNTSVVIRKTADKQSLAIRGMIERDGHFECVEDRMIRVESDAFFWIGEPHS